MVIMEVVAPVLVSLDAIHAQEVVARLVQVGTATHWLHVQLANIEVVAVVQVKDLVLVAQIIMPASTGLVMGALPHLVVVLAVAQIEMMASTGLVMGELAQEIVVLRVAII
jgi:hypothetical protein